MSHGKQFTLYTHNGGPNGLKVAFLLVELGLTFEPIYLDFSKQEQKGPEHTKYNPNGRIPTLIDHHNNDFVLWESCAILLYLVERYDKEHKFSAVTEGDKALQNQWLFFQASGQGPYFGQWFWFTNAHPERIPSAQKRYKDEAARVLGVLEGILKDREWLNGGKYTISDLAFIPWNRLAYDSIIGPDDFQAKFPAVYKWHTAMVNRPAVKAVTDDLAARLEALKAK